MFVVPYKIVLISIKNRYSTDESRINTNDHTLILANVNTKNDKFITLLEIINKERPDIIVLQEINNEWIAELKKIQMDYHHTILKPREDNFGIALLVLYFGNF